MTLNLRSALIGLMIVATLGACSNDSHKASPTTSASTTASTTSTTVAPTTAATTTTTESATTTAAPIPGGTCRTANLNVTAGAAQGAAGTQYFELQFKNRGGAPCTMNGFPGVSFLDRAGHQIGEPASRNVVTHDTITLHPSVTAYATVGVGNPGVTGCTGVPPAEIRVFPPNETAAVLVAPPSGLLVCLTAPGTPIVGPVVSQSTR